MGLMDNANGIIKENPVGVALGAGAIGIGGGLAVGALVGGKSKKKTRKSRANKKRIKHTSRGLKQDRKRRSKQKWEVAYQRRKKKHSKKFKRGIHYTKKGQPYKIMSNGRARFIKKTKRRSK